MKQWNFTWVQEVKLIHFSQKCRTVFCFMFYLFKAHRGERQVSWNDSLLLWKQGALSGLERPREKRLRQHFLHEQTNSASAALHSRHLNTTCNTSFGFRFKRVYGTSGRIKRERHLNSRKTERMWLWTGGVFSSTFCCENLMIVEQSDYMKPPGLLDQVWHRCVCLISWPCAPLIGFLKHYRFHIYMITTQSNVSEENRSQTSRM